MEEEEERKKNLREISALSPDTAVLAEDGGVCEVVTFNIAQEMVIDV